MLYCYFDRVFTKGQPPADKLVQTIKKILFKQEEPSLIMSEQLPINSAMKYFLFGVLLFSVQSCAHLSPGTDRLALLDTYHANRDFGKALALIAATPKEYPQVLEIEKRRKLILDELRSYEKKTIARALKQERKNEWPAAKITYHEALQKSGGSKSLVAAQQAMLHRFQKKLDALEREELIVTGEWLQKKLPLLEDLHSNDPDDLGIQWRYFRTKNDAGEIALQLLQLGEEMLAKKNLAMARRVIPLSLQLSPGPEAKSQMDRLNSLIQARILKKEKDRKKIAGRKDKASIESFNKAMAYGDLAEARYHLSQLTPEVQTSMAVELLQERLDREINEYVQEELSIGNTFYRAGEYDQAVKAWQNIIKLEPENEVVKSKLKRAATVVEKLNSLRKRQTDTTGEQKETSQ